ncbi:MAG: ribulose-phosphate 3-epimerase [Syntrophobacterales bacterium]|nr:ribulose-phosphate 3-epimerase [Syntrophobacterales bacterium]OPX37780.1 MAG: ribulose-phosphate 3-epimerase [Desulfobacteraceae bacterium 4484_190.3]
MKQIAPSILSADFSQLTEEIQKVEEAGADLIHLDVMDGHFVPNLTFGPPVIASIRKVTRLPFDVHLMIEKPERSIQAFVDAGSDFITVHAEAETHINRTIAFIKEKGLKAGVSLNPATPLCLIEEIIKDIDLLMVMSVNPGFGGQIFIQNILEKIKKARNLIDEKAPDVLLEVDGGVNLENIRSLKEAGVDIFVAGSVIFKSKDYKQTIQSMKKILNDD